MRAHAPSIELSRATVVAVGVLGFALEGCEGCNENQLSDGTPPAEEVFDNDAGSWLSMAVTPDARPAIAYYDRDMGALGFAVGTVAADGAVTWAREEVDSYPDENLLNPGDAGKYASLAISGDGQVWIGYQDSSNGTLKYAHKADGTWEIGMADAGGGPTPDAGYWASLAFDASGAPMIAHHDAAKGNLRVARYNGSGFTGAVAAEGEAYDPPDTAADPTLVEAKVGEYADLFVASDGTEYIAYYDAAHGDLKLATGSGGSYTVTTVDDGGAAGGDVGQWPSIAMDGSTLWIAYHDVGNQDLKVAHGTPGSFEVETVDDGDHVGADTAIFVDSGVVGILYFDGFNNDMKLARQKDGGWSKETVAGDAGALGYHNESVRIDTTRYAACYDFTSRSVFFSALP
jgi:hypothetical protein